MQKDAETPRKRHERGLGTWWERDGRWFIEIDLGTVQGQRKRPRRKLPARTGDKATSEADAKRALRKLRDEFRGKSAAQLTAPKPVKVTVADHVKAWLDQKTDVEPATLAEYRALVDRYLAPSVGKTLLADLKAEQISDLYGELRRTRTAMTVRHFHAVLHQALGAQVDWTVAKPPKVRLRDSNRPFLEPDQATAVFAALRGDRYEALAVVAYECQLRPGEVLGLRDKDIRQDDMTLTVMFPIETRGRAEERRHKVTKTDYSRRTVGLTERASRLLGERWQEQQRERDRWERRGRKWPDTGGLLFTTDRGTAPSLSMIYRRHWNPALERAGLPHMDLRSLRRGGGSLLLHSGLSIRDVADQMGHTDPTTTLRFYTHGLERAAGRPREVMERRFGQNG